MEHHLDGRFRDGKAAMVDEREEFEVEGKGLHEHAGKGIGQRGASKQFEPRLRIAERKAEGELDETVVAGADDPSEKRIVETGGGVSLGSNHGIGAGCFHDLEEGDRLFGRKVEIGVEKEDERAAGAFETGPESGAFAHILFEIEPANMRQLLFGPTDLFGCSIGAAIVNGEDFKRNRKTRKEGMDPTEIGGDNGLEVMRRHKDGKGAFGPNQALQSGAGRRRRVGAHDGGRGEGEGLSSGGRRASSSSMIGMPSRMG